MVVHVLVYRQRKAVGVLVRVLLSCSTPPTLVVHELHGVGGIVGAVLTGLLASASVNALSEDADIIKQILGLFAVSAWSAVGTWVVLMVCRFTTGLRVDREGEIEGLDYSQHGETIH